MDRNSTADPTSFLNGALMMLEALPGGAFLLDHQGALLGGNQSFEEELGAIWRSTAEVTNLAEILRDVLGTTQPGFHTFDFSDGTRRGFYCRRFETGGADPFVLGQEDRRKKVAYNIAKSNPALRRSEIEREKDRAAIRKIKAEAQHWRQMSMTDRLTGLFNSIGFRDQATAALARCDRAVLVYADLNGFKSINDTLGHAAGDQLLRDVSETLTLATRATDMVGRVGGDEFAILLVNCSDTDRQKVMERLEKSMARRFPVDRGDGQPTLILRVGAAMGHATFPDDGEDLDDLMRLADARMYDTKRKWHQARKSM